MNGLESMEEDFVVNALDDGKPVKLVQNRGDVRGDRSSGDDPGSSILN